MRLAGQHARPRRQNRWCAVERLNLPIMMAKKANFIPQPPAVMVFLTFRGFFGFAAAFFGDLE